MKTKIDKNGMPWFDTDLGYFPIVCARCGAELGFTYDEGEEVIVEHKGMNRHKILNAVKNI